MISKLESANGRRRSRRAVGAFTIFSSAAAASVHTYSGWNVAMLVIFGLIVALDWQLWWWSEEAVALEIVYGL